MIVQGVYELYEKMASTEWGDEERLNRLVFIGETIRGRMNICGVASTTHHL